jgi:hypothetical protein
MVIDYLKSALKPCSDANKCNLYFCTNQNKAGSCPVTDVWIDHNANSNAGFNKVNIILLNFLEYFQPEIFNEVQSDPYD